MTWYIRHFDRWEKGVRPYQVLMNNYISTYIESLEPGEVPKDGYVCAPTFGDKMMMAHITPLDDNLYQLKDMLGNVIQFSMFLDSPC